MRATDARVVIGMDPHKRSVTIGVMAADEEVLGGGRFGTDTAGFKSMLEYVTQWPDRVWAIEGCNGIGRHVVMRLITEGHEVVDVPPMLSARARVFATRPGPNPTSGPATRPSRRSTPPTHWSHGRWRRAPPPAESDTCSRRPQSACGGSSPTARQRPPDGVGR